MRKIYFRADAGYDIGYGHFIRALALADMLKEHFNCTFFTTDPTEYQLREMATVCRYIALKEKTKFEDFLSYIEGNEIVVLDNYFFTPDYQLKIKEKGCKLVCIDDMHDKHYVADVVINHGLTDVCLFDIEPYTRLCLGFRYALLRKPFLQKYHILKKKNSWFISFGGTDYLNLTEKSIKAIYDDPRVDVINVVIGDAYLYKENLSKYPKVTLMQNLTAEQMASLMRQSEYAILPSSSVCIEALACGCKVASGYFVDNQKEFSESLAEAKIIFYLGNLMNNMITCVDELLHLNLIELPEFSKIQKRYIKLFNSLE